MLQWLSLDRGIETGILRGADQHFVVAMAVPRQRDWNLINLVKTVFGFLSCNGCPSTEGLKHAEPGEHGPGDGGLQWLSLDRGIETVAIHEEIYAIRWLQWLSLDRGIETITSAYLITGEVKGCNGCPSTEGLKLETLWPKELRWSVAMAVPRQRDWNTARSY